VVPCICAVEKPMVVAAVDAIFSPNEEEGGMPVWCVVVAVLTPPPEPAPAPVPAPAAALASVVVVMANGEW
jgi:hypothetical protein